MPTRRSPGPTRTTASKPSTSSPKSSTGNGASSISFRWSATSPATTRWTGSARSFEGYRDSLPDYRRHLLDRFQLIDAARKVVGVGSVGTRCWIALLDGGGDDDPLLLQVKEADASALEAHLQPSAYENHGHRVVEGQRLMQAASDLFLGWTRDPARPRLLLATTARHEGLRRHRPCPLETFLRYAELCGMTLARAHARSGDAAAISGYLGNGEKFGHALARFAITYADQNERDHAALQEAIKDGRVPSEPGV